MRIQATDERKRKWENLKQATGESTKSGALDAAADHYLKMAGGTAAIPVGKIEELMTQAEEQGSVRAAEVAEILNTDELPVQHEERWSVGTSD